LGRLKVALAPTLFAPVNPYGLITIVALPETEPVALALIVTLDALFTAVIVAPLGMLVPAIPQPKCVADDIPVRPLTVVLLIVTVAVVKVVPKVENKLE
jgi:hypothetical protein